MHLEYQPGDMIMVDFAGTKRHYIDVFTGEQVACEVFVAILPSSGLIFCKAVHSQRSQDFVACINDMVFQTAVVLQKQMWHCYFFILKM